MWNKTNILIVDDLKENHLVMESVLTDPELNIIKAMSGEEALSLCLEHDFAVVFMDVQMPGMDGFETAELLRSIERTKNIPIIFVTAISKEQKSIFRGYEAGAVDYLFKPIDPIILKSKARIFKDIYNQRMLIEKQAEELELKVEELENLKAENDILESISMEDCLTCIYNRRGLNRFSKMHWKNCERYELDYSVILIDIDRFKNYNDNYGHLNGDSVLREVASVIKNSLYRSEDIVGRYGGEEFLVIMPNVDSAGAISIAKRIEEGISELNIIHEYNDSKGRLTVSMGIASVIPNEKYSLEELLDEADKLLYKAKHNGRNQFLSTNII
ncbi:MAG: diguanylate cyclase [Acidaminobacteraceae bacterium]